MKRITLTERELTRLIHRVINEETPCKCKGGVGCCGVSHHCNDGEICKQGCCVPSSGIRRQDSDRARRRPYSSKARDMRGSRRRFNEESGSTTHDELMGGIDKMCIDKPWDAEKMVGNRSCGRCHSDLMDLIKDYCLAK